MFLGHCDSYCSCFPLGCGHSRTGPIALKFIDPKWSNDRSPRSLLSDQNLQEFERPTGISVKDLPAPETSMRQLALMKETFQNKGLTIDVCGIDEVWSGLLEDDLVDLKPSRDCI